MRPRSHVLQFTAWSRPRFSPQWSLRRRLMTLAIETSCDDTSVAVIEKGTQRGRTVAQLHFHKKITSNNAEHQGVHPLVSLRSHQRNLATLVSEAINHLPLRHGVSAPGETPHVTARRLPDFISVTRGPGMRSNLFTGLDTAKGLAVAWQKPLVGVHHMQAHALTPRMVSALGSYRKSDGTPNQPFQHQDDSAISTPEFPFLSVLASGGHTLLIHSASLTDHRVMGTTNDIAVGECLDKIARVVLPVELLQTTKSTMYGALLEDFAMPKLRRRDGDNMQEPTGQGSVQPVSASEPATLSAKMYHDRFRHDYDWTFLNHEEATKKNTTHWGWIIYQPLVASDGGSKINSLELSFSGMMTAVERIVRYGTDPDTRKLCKAERTPGDISNEERRDIARETMRAAFEHVASRVVLSLQSLQGSSSPIPAVVVAGGVAANLFLRHILASTLCANGYADVELHFPPPQYCTDNAAMIGYAGLEMFEAGCVNALSIRAIRKWPLDNLMNPKEDG